MEGLDFLGVDAVGHGHGGHGGHRGGRGGFRGGGGPWGWWGGPSVIVVEEPFLDDLDDDARLVLLGADGKVSAVQAALKAAGFPGKDGKPLVTDGIMGPNTAFAITAFWESRNVSHAPVVDDDLMRALGATAVASTAPATDGRPAKGWSQPQPGAMGPAITPESPDPEADKKKWYIVIGGGVAVAIGVALFAFGGSK